jgi:hypothetical protein
MLPFTAAIVAVRIEILNRLHMGDRALPWSSNTIALSSSVPLILPSR